VDEKGRIRRSPRALACLLGHVDELLGTMVTGIALDEQEWSASGGVHLSGTWQSMGTPVLIKLGANVNQLYWTRMVAKSAPDLMPLLYASGGRLGDLELGWTVTERIPCGPLGPGWNGEEFLALLDAAVRFQRAAQSIEPRHIATLDVDMLRPWLEAGITLDPPGPVGEVMEWFEKDFAWVVSVCGLEACHGDVHLCNALTRKPSPLSSAAVLIDCQPVIQPWPFDAAYPQILNSIDRSRVGYRHLVRKMARIRTGYGMPSIKEGDVEALSAICLAWFAIWMWGLSPDRHSIPDYRAETQRYISEGAALRRPHWTRRAKEG
jgi:hypothetical protein